MNGLLLLLVPVASAAAFVVLALLVARWILADYDRRMAAYYVHAARDARYWEPKERT